jgi:hypothetical protein
MRGLGGGPGVRPRSCGRRRKRWDQSSHDSNDQGRPSPPRSGLQLTAFGVALSPASSGPRGQVLIEAGIVDRGQQLWTTLTIIVRMTVVVAREVFAQGFP